jgi:hypothetical protein
MKFVAYTEILIFARILLGAVTYVVSPVKTHLEKVHATDTGPPVLATTRSSAASRTRSSPRSSTPTSSACVTTTRPSPARPSTASLPGSTASLPASRPPSRTPTPRQRASSTSGPAPSSPRSRTALRRLPVPLLPLVAARWAALHGHRSFLPGRRKGEKREGEDRMYASGRGTGRVRR